MKKLLNIIMGIALVGTIASCSDDFLTHDPSDALPSDGAFKTAKDLGNGLNGAYNAFSYYPFYGRNVVALGDMAADNCYMTGASGHFGDIYKYQITEQLGDLKDIWEYGYQVLDRTTRVIVGGEAMLGKASEEDKKSINSSISQAYALRALSTFTLANIFCKPYNVGNENTLGLVLLKNKPIEITDKISRATLKDTYAQILSDITSAKNAQVAAGITPNQYYFNKAAVFALEARVKLYMFDYKGAISAAEAAIAARAGSLIYDKDAYYAQYTSTAISSEDIFVVGKSEEDNLSANSLNTLYDTYGGLVTPQLINSFGKDDIRNVLFKSITGGVRGLKYVGLPASAATSNIPVFKLAEMYLILAESYANDGNLPKSAQNLLVVAKRNPAVATVADLPSTKVDLLKFVKEERQRELFQEGHRWFDLRRNGEQLQRTSGVMPITNYDVYKFCYPIPVNEINASGILQNDKWFDFLPK